MLSWLNLDDAFEHGTQSSYYWYIGDLSDMCKEYLKRPWLHCKIIDHLLIRAMIYQTVLDVGEAIKPVLLGLKKEGILGLHYPPIKGAYSKALQRLELKRAAWGIVSMLAAGLVGFGFANSNGLWAGVVAGFAFWMLLRAREVLMTYEKHNENKQLAQTLGNAKMAYALMDKFPLSPLYLRDRLSAAADEGVPLPVGIFTILDNAIARGPVLWATENYLRFSI